MRIVGPNFCVRLSVKDGVVTEADRPVRYMKGWQLDRVFRLAKRWGWKVEFNDREQARLEQGLPL